MCVCWFSAPLGHISLANAKVARADFAAYRKPFLFQIEHQGGLNVFSCTSDDDLAGWTTALNEHFQRQQEHKMRMERIAQKVEALAPREAGSSAETEHEQAAAAAQRAITNAELDRIRGKLDEMEATAATVLQEKDKLFRIVPSLYQSARDFRTDILKGQVQALQKEYGSLTGFADRVVQETAALRALNDQLSRQMKFQQERSLLREQELQRRNWAQVTAARSEVYVLKAKEYVMLGADFEQLMDSEKVGSKQRFGRVVEDPGSGWRFVWGNKEKKKLDHMFLLKDVESIDIGGSLQLFALASLLMATD